MRGIRRGPKRETRTNHDAFRVQDNQFIFWLLLIKQTEPYSCWLDVSGASVIRLLVGLMLAIFCGLWLFDEFGFCQQTDMLLWCNLDEIELVISLTNCCFLN